MRVSPEKVAPWVISVTLHVGLGLLAVFITWTVVTRPQRDESVLIVADFDALNYEPVAQLSAAQSAGGELVAHDRPATAAPPQRDLLLEMAGAERDPLAELSSAVAASGGTDLSQFAPKASQNGATFGGLSSSNARKIVYAIDASGSMIAFLPFVIDELERSLANLSPKQSFSVIFFQGSHAIEVPPAGSLTAATAPEKSRVLKWIDANIVPRQGTNPLVAIEKALALKPDAIFLLSQNITGYGEFEVDQQDLMALLDKLNPKNAQTGRRTTQINCIQFLDEDRLGTMQAIAKEHGGSSGYKFLSRQELGLK